MTLLLYFILVFIGTPLSPDLDLTERVPIFDILYFWHLCMPPLKPQNTPIPHEKFLQKRMSPYLQCGSFSLYFINYVFGQGDSLTKYPNTTYVSCYFI